MVTAAHFSVDQTEKLVILLVIEHGIVELVRKVLQPQTVVDRIAVDNLLLTRCSLRIDFNNIVDGFFLFSQIFLRCHRASRL